MANYAFFMNITFDLKYARTSDSDEKEDAKPIVPLNRNVQLKVGPMSSELVN